jgi:hypothetical protein
MAVQFFDRRGNETDPNGNEITRGLSSSPGNRSSVYSVEYKKKPKKIIILQSLKRTLIIFKLMGINSLYYIPSATFMLYQLI